MAGLMLGPVTREEQMDLNQVPLDFEKRGLTLLHSERPKLYTILAFLCAIGLSSVTVHLDDMIKAASMQERLIRLDGCDI